MAARGPSQYKGVGKKGAKWRVQWKESDGTHGFEISFNTAELAAKAYDKAWFLHCGDASGPNLGPLTAAELEGLRGVTLAQFADAAKAARKQFAKGTSAFHGVSWTANIGKWRAQVRNPSTGKNEGQGFFVDEEEAARAYDKRALELHGKRAVLNFPAEYRPAVAAAAAAHAAAPEEDSEPDESEASPERIQRWQDKGLLYLAPLPTDDGSFVYANDGEAADGGDGDGDGSEGNDSDLSDTFSGDETFFEEQFPGEAEAALASGDVDHLLACFANPEQLAEAMANCDALALNPAVAELLEIFESHDVEGDAPWLARIAQMRERAATAAEEAKREPWADMWGPKSEPIFRGMPEHKGEGEVCFQPEVDPECPEWPTRPFFNFGADGYRKIYAGNLFAASALIDERVTVERDWIAGSPAARATPMTAQEKELRAKPVDAGSLMFRYTEIYRLLRQKLAVYDYYGWEVNDPGHLNWLRDEITTAKTEMDSWHAGYERDREQRESAELAIAAAAASVAAPLPAPPPVYSDWRAIPQPAYRLHDPFNAQLESIECVGRMSADALEAMLQAQPAKAVITLHADGSETCAGPPVDELHARSAIVAAGYIAEGDARSAEISGTIEEKHAQLEAQLEALAAKTEAIMARCEGHRERKKAAEDEIYLMEMQSREDFRGPLWDTFLGLRAASEARLAGEAAARSVAEQAAATASEAAAAASAHATLAAARAAQFDDAEEVEAAPAELRPGDVGDAFFNEAEEEEMVAEMERQASIKLGRMDLPAAIARVRARIAGADPLVQSCLGAVFKGFAAPGTEEEAAVHTVLQFAALDIAAAVAEREAAEEEE